MLGLYNLIKITGSEIIQMIKLVCSLSVSSHSI